MSKNRIRSRIMLDADVQDLTLEYMKQGGIDSFSRALNALARLGADSLQRWGVMFPSSDREVL